MICRLCDGTCSGSPLDGLITDELAWLWIQLADAADRRSDSSLTSGRASIQVPADVASRTAAAGLLRRRYLSAGRTSVDLAVLAEQLSPLTPGIVAAHASGRRLALRSIQQAQRTASEAELQARLGELVLNATGDHAWAALRRSGWVKRLVDADDAAVLLAHAAEVIARLRAVGEPPVDRRRLAQDATNDPHALDKGRPVAGLSLAILSATGSIPAAGGPRERWAAAGVAYDDITGGLTTIGIAPFGWVIPAGAPVTIPPRVLADCDWPGGVGLRVFVTENPSVLSAAADVPGARVVCTSGTPSQAEVDALGRLAQRGWRLHIRADFDDAGINHVNAILAAAPHAVSWRMDADTYRAGVKVADSGVSLRTDRLIAASWDPTLVTVMAEHGVAVYEETFIEELIADIRPIQ